MSLCSCVHGQKCSRCPWRVFAEQVGQALEELAGEPPREGGSWAWGCGKKGCIGASCSRPRDQSCSSEVGTLMGIATPCSSSWGRQSHYPVYKPMMHPWPQRQGPGRGRRMFCLQTGHIKPSCLLCTGQAMTFADLQMVFLGRGETSATSISQLKNPQLWSWWVQVPGPYSTLTCLFSFFFRCLYNSDGDFLIGELMLWLFLSPTSFYLGCHLPAYLFF